MACGTKIQRRRLVFNNGQLGGFTGAIIGDKPNGSFGFFVTVRFFFQHAQPM